MSQKRPTTYWDYIRVEELLSLQGGLARDESLLSNEEVMFITVHQVYELWFKLVLRELRAARDLFMAERVEEQELSGAVRSLKRARTIFEVAAYHFRVMETLPTREYLAFRDALMPASGFQSAQMRQMEILFGLREEDRISYVAGVDYKDALTGNRGTTTPALRRVLDQLEDRPTLREAIDEWLYRTPIDGHLHDDLYAESRLRQFIERFLDAHRGEVERSRDIALGMTRLESEREHLTALYAKEVAAVREYLTPSEEEGGMRRARIRTAMLFIETYRELPLLAWPREVLDALVELEQAFLIFRQRHARMVERVIGRRTGTGGSAGVDYLDETARRYRIFRDLWAVRTMQIRLDAAPLLENPDFYQFRNGR
jgi:tryptophan 2,3-dioxygenase